MANTMNNKNNSSNHIELSWGGGGTNLFLAPHKKGGFELLDYEFDYERIHEECGGRCYYQSRSGASGDGYINKLGNLTRVGYYRVDTAHNEDEFHHPQKLTDEVSIMIPYMSHQRDKRETLKNYPVVLQVGENTLVYCGFYTTMNQVLEALLAEEKLKEEPHVLKKHFVTTKASWCSPVGHSKEVELKFYLLFGERSFYPWEFATELLRNFWVPYPEERLYQILHLTEDDEGNLTKFVKIGEERYNTGILKEDPCTSLDNAFFEGIGWELVAEASTNMIYKVREDDVYIVGWKPAREAMQQKASRMARFFPEQERNDFLDYIQNYVQENQQKYVEFEIRVPKLLFFLNKEKQFANVRKGIAKKVAEDLHSATAAFASKLNDKKILEAIPDDFIIKFGDSLAAGNCQPGTKSFVDKNFPGQTETTAGELKKFSDNPNVLRIFRYIAKREGLIVKKLEISS